MVICFTMCLRELSTPQMKSTTLNQPIGMHIYSSYQLLYSEHSSEKTFVIFRRWSATTLVRVFFSTKFWPYHDEMLTDPWFRNPLEHFCVVVLYYVVVLC